MRQHAAPCRTSCLTPSPPPDTWCRLVTHGFNRPKLIGAIRKQIGNRLVLPSLDHELDPMIIRSTEKEPPMSDHSDTFLVEEQIPASTSHPMPPSIQPVERDLAKKWVVNYALACIGAFVGLLAFMWALSGFDFSGVSTAGLVAIILGTAFMVLVTVGLMGLVFYSDRSGQDEL